MQKVIIQENIGGVMELLDEFWDRTPLLNKGKSVFVGNRQGKGRYTPKAHACVRYFSSHRKSWRSCAMT